MAGKSKQSNVSESKGQSGGEGGLSVKSAPAWSGRPASLGIAAVGLLVLTLVVWIVSRGLFGGGGASGPEPPQVNRDELSSAVNELLDDAYETVDDYPEEGSSWGLLGQVLYANGFRDEASECFEKAQRLDQSDCRWPYFLGLYVEDSDPDTALQRFEAAIETADYPDVIRMHLAEFYYEQGEKAKCLDLLKLLRSSMGDYARLDLLEARIALQDSDVEQAKTLAERAVTNEPDRPEIHALLSQIYFRLDDQGKAAAEAKLGEAESFGWPDFYIDDMMVFRRDLNYRVYIAENSKLDLEGRIAVLREAVAEEPHVPGWHGRLANYLLEAGNLVEARSVVRKGIERHPESAELHYIDGLVSFFSNDFEPAAVSFRRAIAEKPDYVEAHTNLGMTLRSLDQLPAAIESFQEAVRYQPADVVASYNLAFTMKQFGDLSGALSEYERLIEMEPEVPDPYIDAAELHLAVDQKAQAKTYLERALELEPENERAQQLMNQIPQ